jgi:polysaccharide deacetylase family protein (PEP-CTERM system associated)
LSRLSSLPGSSAPDVFTIDVEDWFHARISAKTPEDLESWTRFAPRVEADVRKTLELLARSNVKATCFFLGWIASRYPQLVRETSALGHEVASHGYGHRNVRKLTRAQFREDIRSAKAAIENAVGGCVRGYRAPGFSITGESPWAFEEIVEAGYLYDSSVFPCAHGGSGIPTAPRQPYTVNTPSGLLTEFPATVVATPFGVQCPFGGGYFRLLPLWLIQAMARRARERGRGIFWYMHPREIDPRHPRLPMPLRRRFKNYFNVASCARKLEAALLYSHFATFGELFDRRQAGSFAAPDESTEIVAN